MTSNPRRSLTREEQLVLVEVQELWGPQNSEADVFFTQANDAALFVKARDGSSPVAVVLTNLGRWYAEGSLTLEELHRQILGPASASGLTRFRAAIVRRFRHRRPAQ